MKEWAKKRKLNVPNHDPSLSDIISVSSGLVLLFKPPNAEIITVGYEMESPISKCSMVMTMHARN